MAKAVESLDDNISDDDNSCSETNTVTESTYFQEDYINHSEKQEFILIGYNQRGQTTTMQIVTQKIQY